MLSEQVKGHAGAVSHPAVSTLAHVSAGTQILSNSVLTSSLVNSESYKRSPAQFCSCTRTLFSSKFSRFPDTHEPYSAIILLNLSSNESSTVEYVTEIEYHEFSSVNLENEK